MKIFRSIAVLIILAGITVQCSHDPKSKIKELEKKIGSEKFTLDEKGMQLADELVKEYISYADSHKDSPEAPDYLYSAADLSLNIGKSKEALDLYNQIIYKYPDYAKAPECLFLVGYIYENYFQQYGKAKEIYEVGPGRPLRDFFKTIGVTCQSITGLAAAEKGFACAT